MTKREMPLSGNALKLIAALSMLFDHIGVMLFPQLLFLRILGRLSFPIFAFFIAEGCRYTKNRARYLLTLSSMAVLFQIVFFLAIDSLYMSVFVTFSLSVCLIYLLDECKKSLTSDSAKVQKILWTSAFFLALVGVYLLNIFLSIDYGFLGCITPLCANLFQGSEGKWKVLDSIPCRVGALAFPLVALAFTFSLSVQPYSLLAIPLLLLYSGKRGRYKMKYFFYLFYPAHLVILYAVSFLL